jgi:hypothetical protein
MARTAVVAGTATAVSNRVSRRQANKWAQQGDPYQPRTPAYQYEGSQAQQGQYEEAPPPPAPAPPAGEDRMEQLKQLGELKEQGVLTDEEFAAEKARILGS